MTGTPHECPCHTHRPRVPHEHACVHVLTGTENSHTEEQRSPATNRILLPDRARLQSLPQARVCTSQRGSRRGHGQESREPVAVVLSGPIPPRSLFTRHRPLRGAPCSELTYFHTRWPRHTLRCLRAQVLGVWVTLPSTKSAHRGCRSRDSGDRDSLLVGEAPTPSPRYRQGNQGPGRRGCHAGVQGRVQQNLVRHVAHTMLTTGCAGEAGAHRLPPSCHGAGGGVCLPKHSDWEQTAGRTRHRRAGP